MAVKSPAILPSLADDEESPAKRLRVLNTPPIEADELDRIIGASSTFVKIKADLVSGNKDALTASWERLLGQLRDEVKVIVQTGPRIVTEIDFKDLSASAEADAFLRDLRIRGGAVVRNLIPDDEAASWTHDLDNYLRDNPHTKASPPENPELYELFWSLAQLNARAHPNMLAAQKFLMSGGWQHSSASRERLSSNFPVTYADRVRMTHRSLRGSSPGFSKTTPPVNTSARIDGVGVGIGVGIGVGDERWETDSYGGLLATEANTKTWSGEWDDFDPWEISTRLDETSDLDDDGDPPSVFKMFQGMLPLSQGSSDDDPPMRLCQLPLKLTTAYLLLRPLFSPRRPLADNREDFLDPSNWALDMMQSSHNNNSPTLRPSLAQQINDTLHPHLALDQTLIALPPLNPGDFVVWHPDTIHAPSPPPSPSPSPPTPSQPQQAKGTLPQLLPPPPPPSPSTVIYVPTCPLTQNNARYLARQRKAFLLGLPGPDFATTAAEIGESCHMGRPGVQEINEAGGEEALRAMGLLAWEEDDDAVNGSERVVLKMANAVLFPLG